MLAQPGSVNQQRESNIADGLGNLNGAADNGLTIAVGIHYMKFGEDAAGALKWVDKAAGVTSIINNLRKSWNERKTNGWQAASHFSEAIGQGEAMFSGVEEVELAWNIGSIVIDTGVDYCNHSHGNK